MNKFKISDIVQTNLAFFEGFDYKKHEEMTTKQANIIIAIIAGCFIGIGLVNYFNIQG